MNLAVHKAAVAEEQKELAIEVAFDLVKDLTDGELVLLRDKVLLEQLESELDRREKKLEKQQKKRRLEGGGEASAGVGLGWGGGLPLGMGAMGMGTVGMGTVGVAGMGLGGMMGSGAAPMFGAAGAFGGPQAKKFKAVECYLCGSGEHRVNNCPRNIARWDYTVFQRLIRAGKTREQILQEMASAGAPGQLGSGSGFRPHGGGGVIGQ
jgi:hypothetical protein